MNPAYRIWHACQYSIFALVLVLAIQPTCSFAQDDDATRAAKKYVGEYEKTGQGVQGIQVASLGESDFRLVIYTGGLPGNGWNRQQPQVVEMELEELEAFLKDKSVSRIDRLSPTIDARPPQDATILFDGSEKSLKENWQDGAKLSDGKYLLGGATSLAKFNDYKLHLEFQTPWMPTASGQGRGNSGVYHQARYETQVLDSFGFENEGNTCGAIYGVKPADFNACLPPLVWQTYDVEFVAARWDESGKKTSNAKLTVWLNGQLIHRDQEVPGPTTAAPGKETREPGPLYLQDHGNPVIYRNIWIVPMDATTAALRPRVPGFERFASMATDVEQIREGGRLLISELGCLACHAAGKFEQVLEKKEAPILDQVASRLRSGYVASMLTDLHGSKVGTTMPDLMHGMSAKDRTETIDAISAFLESTGKSRRRTRFDKTAASRGEQLYAKIGCAVCHGFPDGRAVTTTSVPLPDLSKKYSFDGLAGFLKQPHSVRPSGRMPGLDLNDDEVRDVATYLLPISDPSELRPNLHYKVYEGSWDKIPEFGSLKPSSEGTCEGLDLTVANKTSNFGVSFESFLLIDAEATYRFHLGSDDGSRLWIDGKSVVDVDGVHPHHTSSGEIKLTAGFHRLRVDYIQGGGEWTIELEIESPNLVRQPIDGWLHLEDRVPSKPASEQEVDKNTIEKGKELFVSVGCAQCHKLNLVDQFQAKYGSKPKPLDQVNLNAGCLAAKPATNSADYKLTSSQRRAIITALESDAPTTRSEEAHSRYVMTKLNCVACHVRDGLGGPEADKLELFTSTIPEMGDESRIPPLLTGIGDKLTDAYLEKVLTSGARQRPYMNTRMPQFHDATKGLAQNWIQSDRPQNETMAEVIQDTESRRLAFGRQLMGTKGLACVQCHTFGNEPAIGIQAINLLTMPQRIRPEWFHRYMLAPTKYRPGTRMPASFPNGTSLLASIYSGDASSQIRAMWEFLKQGDQAATPEGLQSNQIVLEPKDRAIIYRNFIQGLSPRGIAVGYPGGLNVAWDAGTYSLSMLWHGQFIDASKHWRDRGAGNQRPLGDHVLLFENAPPVALLADANSPWPKESVDTQGYKFKGYNLDKKGQPTFRYTLGKVLVADKPECVVAEGKDAGLKRTLTVESADKTISTVHVRLATGSKIEATQDGTWSIDDNAVLHLLNKVPGTPTIRDSQGKKELILQLNQLGPGPIRIEYELHW
jgi:mono/diheme cytochrome c family protein